MDPNLFTFGGLNKDQNPNFNGKNLLVIGELGTHLHPYG